MQTFRGVVRGCLALAIVSSGCASSGSLAAGTPTTPRLNQTAAQHNADIEACAQQAQRDSARESVDMLYQACMVSKGYKTAVGVGASMFMDVDARGTRPYGTVLTDLRSCLASKPEVGGGKIALAAMFGAGVLAADAAAAVDAFASCMTPKGYEVQRWMP